MTRITRDSLGYAVLIIFSIVLLTWAIPKYTPEYPGYGAPADLVPIVAVCVMLVMALVSLTRVLVALKLGRPIAPQERDYPEDRAEGGGFTQVGRVNLKHLASIMIPAILLLVAIEYVGYIPASLAFLILLQYLIGSRRWVQSIVIAVALTAVLYIIMRYGFGVPVPGPQLF
ncbi:MAG: tripartite tricarboxylate transporter TctB family protein [Pseudomonadota bacterium]